jgi:hypothetical protein
MTRQIFRVDALSMPSLQVSRIFPGPPSSEQPLSITESCEGESPPVRHFSQMGGVYQRIQPGARLCRAPYGAEEILDAFR